MNPDAPMNTGADDARLELVMAASASERANRPRGLVLLAGIVLVGAIIYAVMGISSRSAAAGEVATERSESDQVAQMVERIRGLQAAQALRGLEPNSRIGPEIEALAESQGLKADPTGKKLVITESEVSGIAVPGIVQRKYRATLVGQEPEAILNWLNLVQSSEQTRGVEIFSISMKPEPLGSRGAWNLDVDFVRWERK